MNEIKNNRNRSRRLRKKLHVGEFQEFGFEFDATLKTKLSPEAEEALADKFLLEVVEARGLVMGGWITGGFIAKDGHGSTTDEDREAVEKWLKSVPEIASIKVGQLIDAWNAPEYGLTSQ